MPSPAHSLPCPLRTHADSQQDYCYFGGQEGLLERCSSENHRNFRQASTEAEIRCWILPDFIYARRTELMSFALQDYWVNRNYYLANLRTIYSATEDLLNIYGSNGQRQALRLISSSDNIYSRAGINRMLLPHKRAAQTQSAEHQSPGCSTEPISKFQFCDTVPGSAPDTGPTGPGPQLWISGVGTEIAGTFPTIQTAGHAEHRLSAARSWCLPRAPMWGASQSCQPVSPLCAHLNDCTVIEHCRLQHRVLLQLKRRFSSSF